MGSRNRSSWWGSVRDGLRHAVSPLSGSGRGGLGIAMLAVLLLTGVYIAWQKWGAAIRQGPRYILTSDSIEVTPCPPWIQSDVKAEVIRDGQLENLSVLDPELTKQVVYAFQLHPWVAKVLWAGKRPGKDGPRIIVELKYREPIAMVLAEEENWEGYLFWPVDTEGVLLPPSEFSQMQTCDYLRLDVGDVRPVGTVGTAFGDPGVAGAVAVATRIGGLWREMGLEWVVVRPATDRTVNLEPELFCLLLPRGSDPKRIQPRVGLEGGAGIAAAQSLCVLWGRVPGQERQGEAKATVKITRLRQFVRQNGQLDQLPETTVVDLRAEDSLVVYDRSSNIQPASMQ